MQDMCINGGVSQGCVQADGIAPPKSGYDNREGRPTVDKRMTEEEARRIGERTWLHFYNQILMDQGIITEDQYIRMQMRIVNRKTSSMT